MLVYYGCWVQTAFTTSLYGCVAKQGAVCLRIYCLHYKMMTAECCVTLPDYNYNKII